jgi:pimeloyl-ACP methyl ester carboxylesterase
MTTPRGDAPVCRTESYKKQPSHPTAASSGDRCSAKLQIDILPLMTETSIHRPRELFSPGHDRKRIATLDVDGRPVAFQDVGSGPAVIVAHTAAGAHDFWAPFVTMLSNHYRVLTPRLLGYGWMESGVGAMRSHPWFDCATLLTLAEHVGERVHLVGHAYGGTVALEAARALGKRARSLTLIEPIAFHLLKLTSQMRESGEIPTYRRLGVRTRLIVGQRTPAPARAIVDELTHILPDGHVRVLPRAGHMSPLTHPAELSALIVEHIDSVIGRCEPDCEETTPTGQRRRSIA